MLPRNSPRPTRPGWRVRLEPAERSRGPLREAQRRILSHVYEHARKGRAERSSETGGWFHFPPVSVLVAGDRVSVGGILRNSFEVPISLYTGADPLDPAGALAIDPGPATLRVRAPAHPRAAPLFELHRERCVGVFRLTDRPIRVHLGEVAAVMDYVKALVDAEPVLADFVRALIPLRGKLGREQRRLSLGFASAGHPIRLCLPTELVSGAEGFDYELDFPWTDPADVERGVVARLTVGGVAWHYDFADSLRPGACIEPCGRNAGAGDG